ncbi:hypothetical protein EW146_g280 [Bondarzewia mesenterica]|uniref:UNC-45/Cro1/She4 central domain-containing protein n=1 Tax=Bondarzewia mesenterica TaxID=1095465 RepID=A0A4S4M9P3_9AGAM|nr:hypothetical protein EW146_g280 [Bondarzewia mesenterica]
MVSITDTDGEQTLDTLLTKSQDHTSILPDEISYLITAFTPSQESSFRSKAYLILSSFCQGVRASSPPSEDPQNDHATQSLTETFAPTVGSRLAEPTEPEVIVGLSFLSALFQVDWQSASAIFQQESILTSIADILDLYPSENVAKEAAHLLSHASGHKACRAAMPSECIQWLQSSLRQTKDMTLRAAAAIAIVKLSRGATTDAADLSGVQRAPPTGADAELVTLMRGLVIDGGSDSIGDAVEGLAYLTVEASVKETLSKDSELLTRLFSLIPSKKQSTSSNDPAFSLLFGIIMIISNICAYQPRLSSEDAQMEKLRRMAKTGAGSGQKLEDVSSDPLEDDEHAKDRGRRMVKYGALNVVTTAIRVTDGRGVRAAASKALLSLTEDKDNRGKILQNGGSKALMIFIRQSLSTASSSGSHRAADALDQVDLEAIQTLAKLAITSSPIQVFGPDEGVIFDAIRPLSILLTHPSSTLLQRFEATMALTNLSSHSAESASRVAKADGLLAKVEFLVLEEHVLTRRAAAELLCNLVAGSEDVFERYTGGDSPSERAKSKLHVLLALSDVDDLPTRLAASGALAVLTASPNACRTLRDLENEQHRVLRTFTQLIDPSVVSVYDGQTGDSVSDPGLVHRGVVCVRNCLFNVDQESRRALAGMDETKELIKALTNALKANTENQLVLRPVVETLKMLIDSGVKVDLA